MYASHYEINFIIYVFFFFFFAYLDFLLEQIKPHKEFAGYCSWDKAKRFGEPDRYKGTFTFHGSTINMFPPSYVDIHPFIPFICGCLNLLQFLADDFTVMLFHYDKAVNEWDDMEWSHRVIHVSASNQTKW